MTSPEIQKLLQKLSFMHDKFQNVNYKLSPIDVEAVKQVTAQLYAECLAFRAEEPRKVVSLDVPAKTSQSIPAPTPKPPVSSTSQSTEVEEMNSELDEVFEAPAPNPQPKPTPPPAPKPVTQVQKPTSKEPKPIDLNQYLGINEQIMFANELYDGSKPALVNTLRKLTEMPSREKAISHFDEVLEPFFSQEKKDAEVVQEFRDLLERVL